MVDVIIVYESIFGNTRVIAEAVADGVGGYRRTGRRPVSVVKQAPGG